MVKTGTATPLRPRVWRECRGWDTWGWDTWAGDKAVCLTLAAVLQRGLSPLGCPEHQVQQALEFQPEVSAQPLRGTSGRAFTSV